jgi:hypothetical protein
MLRQDKFSAVVARDKSATKVRGINQVERSVMFISRFRNDAQGLARFSVAGGANR